MHSVTPTPFGRKTLQCVPKAGVQFPAKMGERGMLWIPACAGMTP